MAEGKSEEHSLEYQELFNEYLLMFEGKLEEFIGESRCGRRLQISLCSLRGASGGVDYRPALKKEGSTMVFGGRLAVS